MCIKKGGTLVTRDYMNVYTLYYVDTILIHMAAIVALAYNTTSMKVLQSNEILLGF
jgi:hypothetical protein